MDIILSHYTASGKRRNNEDSYSFEENDTSLLTVVADGLGGHDDGEVASKQAVTTITKMLWSKQPDEDRLVDAIRYASTEINKLQEKHRTMRTTVAVLWVSSDFAIAANVGDSRIYQFRDGKIIYQSMDHSMAQMAVLVGELEASQIRSSKERNKLIRVLGDSAPPKVDSEILSVRKGDRFLLCSDGFWEPVTETIMQETSRTADSVKDWLARMKAHVEYINDPRQDNHTAVALEIR